MGNKQKKSSGGKKKKQAQNSAIDPDAAGSIGGNSYGLIMVDPARCRFQHSKIRPYFSGCGRSLYDTLEDMKEGKTKISELPPIQVLVGDESMDDDQGPWYFSLNNRRLWVLKRLREEGFLQKFGNKVAVRVRRPKSQQEKERYTLANCALEARLMPEKKRIPQKQDRKSDDVKSTPTVLDGEDADDGKNLKEDIRDEEPPKTNSDNEVPVYDDAEDSGDDNETDIRATISTRNRFAHMMLDDSSSSSDDDG